MKRLFLFALFFFFAGCSVFELSHEMEKTAHELAAEGSSVKAYTDLKDWYPFSKYAILAELKIADSHFHLKEYDEAVAGYEEFEKMHPKNDAIPYVIYQNGLCWFEQMETIDRDSSPAKNSLIQFDRLISRFPESEYVGKAKEKMAECVSSISGHELNIANFYLKTKQYKAALKRYEYIVENYPDSEESREALNKISKYHSLADKK